MEVGKYSLGCTASLLELYGAGAVKRAVKSENDEFNSGGAAWRGDLAGRGLLSTKRIGVPVGELAV
jgi:hypothetical protein